MVGHRKRKRSIEHRSVFGPGPPINIIILVIALALLFIEHITTSLVYTNPQGCDIGRLFLFGGEGISWGAHGTLIVAATLLLVFAVAHLLISFIQSKRLKATELSVQGVNIVLILLIIRSLAVSWAYYHPFAPLAQMVHAHDKQYSHAAIILTDYVYETDEWFDERSWRCIENNEYGCVQYNEELKITARQMLFSQCVSPTVMSKNWEAYQGTPLPENHPNTLIKYAYFDADGAWVRRPHWLMSRSYIASKTLGAKGIEMSNLDWYDMWYQLEEQYEKREEEAKALQDPIRPLTLREIELRVANAWGDDRPAWWKDDE
ncbi:hypothetical protein RYZ27_10580 [Hyphomonas sp. FCG-A18]|uniref:hypothetical protein n=1 Tax=Hyphomonas sp. FCG-A18 TaxID=3080019 RepID=UPI002B3174E1|nr:hypothetical protein RYZ27_10580 [Hyphomonas sp. FCG-A18]